MKFNLFKLQISNDVELTKIDNRNCPLSILNALEKFESKLINRILEEQETRWGFYKLGNFIRYELNDFFCVYNNDVLIKSTENQRSLHKIVMEWIEESYKKNVYLFLYENSFGKKIVDGSTINVESIKITFEDILSLFELKKPTIFFVIEMTEFSDFRLEKKDEKINNKQFYKLVRNVN